MKIQDKAMLVSLSISQWRGAKIDKKAGKVITDYYGARENAAKVIKRLAAKEEMDKMNKAFGKIRTYYYANTAAYPIKGQQILATIHYPEFMGEISNLISKADEAVEGFLTYWKDERNDAREALGGMFDPKDFPTVDQLRNRFKIKVWFLPLPADADIPLAMNKDDLEDFRKEIADQLHESYRYCVNDLWDRVKEVVVNVKTAMAGNLNGKEKRFHGSLIGNVRRIAELLPKLNFTGDANLNVIADEISKGLAEFDIEELKDSEDARKDALTEANRILEKMKMFAGGNSPAPSPKQVDEKPEPKPEPKAKVTPIKAAPVKVEPKEDEPETDIERKLRKAGII